ncbi:MAG: NDP-sugar synthase [Dehalococcoidales bacterium]|jgi:mannose-1-phosphate guanylyltransferase|nr:NDP-sugar synthase [Dehalococcoidales bacterium]
MQALILVGGEATRLRPLTCNMPKSMVPVLNTPFLEHVLKYLAGHDIRDIILAQRYLPEVMEKYFQDGSRFGVKLTHSMEKIPLNTAGAVKNAEQFIKGRLVVLNGDIFTDLDISRMLQFHLEKKALVTIALTPVEDPSAYGLVETTPQGRITRFLEKPKKEEITTNMINAGVYILESEVLAKIPPQTNYSFERQLFPSLLAEGAPVYGFACTGYWIDIGTPDKYCQLHKDLLEGKLQHYSQDNGYPETGYQIHPEARIEGKVVIGDNCVIKRGAVIKGPTVIGPHSLVEEETVIQESVIWHNVTAGPRATINGCLIANDCYLQAGCVLEKSVLGDHITITCNTRLGPGSRIWPPAGHG